MDTKLTNIITNAVIELDDELYPTDEHDWSPVVASSEYTLTGALAIQQGVRLAGKPITLQSQEDMGWLTRDTVNTLRAECAKVETTFWLDYIADDAIQRVKVMFDHAKNPIEAAPMKGFISPRADDFFLVTLRFIEVN